MDCHFSRPGYETCICSPEIVTEYSPEIDGVSMSADVPNWSDSRIAFSSMIGPPVRLMMNLGRVTMRSSVSPFCSSDPRNG